MRARTHGYPMKSKIRAWLFLLFCVRWAHRWRQNRAVGAPLAPKL
jgi:hypothetical protein